MSPGLGEDPFTRVDEDDRNIGGGGAGDHVTGVLLMPWSVGDDIFALFGREEAVGDVDGDPLLPLTLQSVDQQCHVDLLTGGSVFATFALRRRQLILEDHLGIIKHPSNQRTFAVIHRSTGQETEHILILMLFEIRLDIYINLFFAIHSFPSSFKIQHSTFNILKVSLNLLQLHRAFLVFVDEAAFTFTTGRKKHFTDDLRESRRFGVDGSREGIAAQRPEADFFHLRLFAKLFGHPIVVDHDFGPFVLDDGTFLGEIEGGDGNLLKVDVLPNIQLSPVGDGEDPHAFTFVNPGIVDVPEFGTLIFGIPTVMFVTEREDPLFGPALLFVPSGPADDGIVSTGIEGLFESFGFHDVGVHLATVNEGVDIHLLAAGIGVDNQIEAQLFGATIPKLDHLFEFPLRIDM